MAKNRYNTPPVDYSPRTEKQKVEEPTITPQPCMVCGKVMQGAYGRWEDGWTCSKTCESTYEENRK